MNTKPKILMIGSHSSVTGGMSTVIELYNGYNIFKDYAIFLASYKRGSVIYRIAFFIKFLFVYLYKLMSVHSIKIVHVHSSYKGSFFRKAIILNIAKLFHKKTIFHLHGSEFSIFYNESPDFIKKMITNTLNKTDLIIVLSEQWKSTISNISTNNNVKVLYNPTVIKEISSDKSKLVKIAFMGRLCKRKGTYDIIEAAKYINSNLEINLYGDGNIDEFQKLINDNHLQQKVKIMGWISGKEKEEVLKNSDIYLLPSYNEGLPMSILEAMAHALPIISTPVGGIPEAVEEGVNGFLVGPGDYKEIAKKIDLLAEDKPLREKMGQESYKIAKEKFDIKIIIKQLQDIYDEMIK